MMTIAFRCRWQKFGRALLLVSFAAATYAQAAAAGEQPVAPAEKARNEQALRQLHKIQDDCRLPVTAGSYRLSWQQCRSVRGYPDYFLSGALAPDIYPDPLAARLTLQKSGQAVEGGWQHRDWLNHLLGNAAPGAGQSFALGYLLHAGKDAFAGLPAGPFAGGRFRPETKSADTRALEYSARDLLDGSDRVPTIFLKDTLLFDSEVQQQYRRAGDVQHLVAMNAVRQAVENMTFDLESLEGITTEMLAHYQAEDLSRESRQQMAASLWPQLREHEKLLGAYKKSLAAVDENTAQQAALQSRLEADMAAIGAAVHDWQELESGLVQQRDAVLQQQKKLAQTPRMAATENCRNVRKWINKKEWITNRVCLPARVASTEWTTESQTLALEKKRVTELEQKLESLRAARAAAIMAAEHDRLALQQQESQGRQLELQRQLADKAYRLSLGRLQSEQLPALAAGGPVPVSADDVELLQALLDERAAMLQALRQSLADMHELSFAGRSWLTAIDHASDQYFYTASRLSRQAVATPDVGGEYRRWLSCDGHAFLDKPYNATACASPLPAAVVGSILTRLEQTLRTPGLGELSDLYQDVQRRSVTTLWQATADADARLAAFVAPDGALAKMMLPRDAAMPVSDGTSRPANEVVQK